MQVTNTRKQIFYPYKYINHSLELNIKELKLDNSIKNELIDLDGRKINLVNLEFDDITLSITLSAEQKQFQSVFNKNERPIPPCNAYIVLNCDETKYRHSIMLSSDSEINWQGEIKLHKNNFRNSISLIAYIIRNNDYSGDNDGFAKSFGEKLLSSNEWTIQIDEQNKFLGNFLPCEWEDFKKSSHPVLSKNPDLLYYLDFDSDPPRLILNESIENLKSVLSNEAKNGVIATIRDVIFDSISQQVWVNLILTAAQSVEDAEELRSWQEAVLKQYAPLIYTDSDEIIAINNLIKDSQNKAEIHTLLSKINITVQNRLRIDKSTRDLLNISLKENNSI